MVMFVEDLNEAISKLLLWQLEERIKRETCPGLRVILYAVSRQGGCRGRRANKQTWSATLSQQTSNLPWQTTDIVITRNYLSSSSHVTDRFITIKTMHYSTAVALSPRPGLLLIAPRVCDLNGHVQTPFRSHTPGKCCVGHL